jgi:hypothetical protein
MRVKVGLRARLFVMAGTAPAAVGALFPLRPVVFLGAEKGACLESGLVMGLFIF